MKVLQVSPQDSGGGAEKVALDLHQSFRKHNIDGRLFVRFRRTAVGEVYEMNGIVGWVIWSRIRSKGDFLERGE